MANDFQLDFIANAQKLDSSIKSVVQSKTYKVKVEAEGTQVQSLTKSTEKFVDVQGRAIQVNTNFDKSGKATSATIKDITKETKSAGTAIETASKQTKSWGEDFVITMGKVAKFFVITKIIQTFTQAISESYTVVKEFDDALTDFKKVSDLSGDSLDAYTEKLGGLGEAVARTRTEMVQASTEFKKSGYSDEDSAQLAQIASLYQNVADSELSAGDASSFVISQMKAFNITTDEAITIIDRVNEVDKLAFLIEI